MSERHFDKVFGEHHLTPDERVALVWRLASLRFQRTIEALLVPTKKRKSPPASRPKE